MLLDRQTGTAKQTNRQIPSYLRKHHLNSNGPGHLGFQQFLLSGPVLLVTLELSVPGSRPNSKTEPHLQVLSSIFNCICLQSFTACNLLFLHVAKTAAMLFPLRCVPEYPYLFHRAVVKLN